MTPEQAADVAAAVQALVDAHYDLWQAQLEADEDAAERSAETGEASSWSEQESMRVDELGQAMAAADAKVQTLLGIAPEAGR